MSISYYQFKFNFFIYCQFQYQYLCYLFLSLLSLVSFRVIKFFLTSSECGLMGELVATVSLTVYERSYGWEDIFRTQ